MGERRGSVRIPQPPSYAYVTSDPMAGTAGPYEQLPGGSKASVCDGYPLSASSPPFGAARQSGLTAGVARRDITLGAIGCARRGTAPAPGESPTEKADGV